ncbi:MAG: PEP-CTERM sorting domain-containing protein [Gammaproteobacteria bacterium]
MLDGNFYAIQNIKYAGAKQVPEPTTLALFGLGLTALGFARRKIA